MATLQEARALADEVTDAVGIDPVTVTVNRRLRTVLGRCYTARREVQLAGWLMAMEGNEWAETVRHEVAHQLAVDTHGTMGRGHGWRWVAACRKTGASGRTMPGEVAAKQWKHAIVYGCGQGCETPRTRRTKLGKGGHHCRKHGLTILELREEGVGA